MIIRGGSKTKHGENNPPATHLDHDHREREDIRLLTKCPIPFKDLWRSPLCGVTMPPRGASYGIWVLGDCGKTEIRNSRAVHASGKRSGGYEVYVGPCSTCGLVDKFPVRSAT